jgi:hypothetical protein
VSYFEGSHAMTARPCCRERTRKGKELGNEEDKGLGSGLYRLKCTQII